MRRRVGVMAALLSALALCCNVATAAEIAVDQPAPTAKPGPEPIPQADIALRADLDERFAREVIQRSEGRDPAARLEPRIQKLGEAVQRESELFKRDELKLISVGRLESLDRHWSFYAKQLADLRSDLKQASSQYTEDAAELAKRRTTWEATRAAAGEDGIAPALNNRVLTMMAQLALAEQAVSGPIDKLISVGRRATVIESGILASQKAVAAAIAYNDRRLARIDSPPLWEIWNRLELSDAALQSLKTGLEVESRFLAEYNAANARYLRAMHVAALLLLPLLLLLSRRSRKVESDDPAMQASIRVMQRPISAWLVLTLLAVLVLEPDSPILRHEIALLLALVPVLRLLPVSVYRVLGPWPYIATGLYLLHRLGFLLVANDFLYRTYLLAITLLTAALTGWLLWRARPRRGGPSLPVMHRLVRFAGWFAIVGLLVSATANLVGNVSLAEMLTVAVLDVGYVGLVLYAGVTVLASVLRLLLARRVISRFRVVTQHAGPLIESVTKLLKLAAFAIWVIVALHKFRIYRPIHDATVAVLEHEFTFGQISLTLGGVLLFLFSVWLAFWAAKTVRYVLHDEVLPKMSLPRGVANSVASLTYYAVVILGLFVALAAAGFEVGQLAIVVGALGVGIGLGLQDVVNNFVSGLILMFERPIQPGDVVEVGGTAGKVREIGMRATRLNTFEGADVVVPNGILLSEKLINWTLSDMDRRIDVNVGVAYGTDPRQVLDLLLEVTKSTEGIASEPAPNVLFTGFGASSLDFCIRAWTNNFVDWVNIRSELTVRVHEALKAAEIEIPFPQQDVHVRTVSPEAGALLASRSAAAQVAPQAEAAPAAAAAPPESEKPA